MRFERGEYSRIERGGPLPWPEMLLDMRRAFQAAGIVFSGQDSSCKTYPSIAKRRLMPRSPILVMARPT
ncbi:hypothetical protein MPLDJ20_150039 [Mesorhizobium plurifarium]|uniref:Uncharacterized protein n=1 Tax=Mesorhizobium plurifarium TaxID=69974 RepID=A0A090EMH6_MESPL|nr:hypothetical protein MPLDJ20_150039 [Mesorhizobium plurifarium]